ncbi:hypothetical protein SAMN04487895_101571 [Paenibacillus sophorae]|uniref:Uncharacterized protein n=1 Tax=Paenibacillus sophorae TaxID=1333845 RepID=A0A1H8GMR8_9BACL|nr:hypothetical protein [Paenibacillus sophorae]QWU14274.1 hypothetical protein KP014_20420 [Paenibacillus sophorae]SEN45110.1 hypothetical protein SAMN04487895_101571 [Paenibacillus sophorae]
MKKIIITKSESWNWYNVNEEYYIKDAHKYRDIGVQVIVEKNGECPDVVSHGHYEYI